jgi:hypothetical protein
LKNSENCSGSQLWRSRVNLFSFHSLMCRHKNIKIVALCIVIASKQLINSFHKRHAMHSDIVENISALFDCVTKVIREIQ